MTKLVCSFIFVQLLLHVIALLQSLQGYDPQQEPIPHKLQLHIQDWSNKPLGQGLPRKAWVQLNRLRTGIGKFGDSIVKWGFGDDNPCRCEEPQTAYHFVNPLRTIRI